MSAQEASITQSRRQHQTHGVDFPHTSHVGWDKYFKWQVHAFGRTPANLSRATTELRLPSPLERVANTISLNWLAKFVDESAMPPSILLTALSMSSCKPSSSSVWITLASSLQKSGWVRRRTSP
eukprot:1972895-Amphidinium_carterae.1